MSSQRESEFRIHHGDTPAECIERRMYRYHHMKSLFLDTALDNGISRKCEPETKDMNARILIGRFDTSF